MYGGYYNGPYGNPEYGTAPQGQEQPAQQYYTGVNPYANYGYGGVNAPLPPPPPPPPAQTAFHTFPSTTTTPTAYSQTAHYQRAQAAAAATAHVFAGGQFNGYDNAVFNYAQKSKTPPVLHQQNPHHSNNHQKLWKHGGGGRQGRPQTGSTDNKLYYCETCKISCAGGITYKEHLEGQRHKKKEISIKTGVPITSLAKNKLSYRCELCDVTCTGQDTYGAHIRGGKHLKTQQLHRKMGKPVPEDVPTIIAPGEDGPVETRAKPKWHQQQLPGTKKVIGINTVNFVGGHKLNSTGQLEEKKREVAQAVSSAGKRPAPPIIEVEDERLKAMMAAEEVQPIGEEHVEDERDASGKLLQYHCKICDCKFSDPNAKEIHVKGRRHRLSYKQKIDPTFVVDPKVGGASARKPKKSGGGASDPASMDLPKFGIPSPDGREFNILDERTVDRKYGLIVPGYTVEIDEFVSNIKKSLCTISDKLLHEDHMELAKHPQSLEEIEQHLAKEPPGRTILGCVRVGVCAKNTYIVGEPYLELVMTCTPIPTNELIARIIEEFPATTTDMTIELDAISPVVLSISTSKFTDLKCRVIVTSVAIRNEEPQQQENENSSECPDRETSIRALQMMRSAKWFDTHCMYLNSCQQTIRLYRDLRSRYPIWHVLDDYKLELLVANIIDSSTSPLSVGEAFKRVLEAISSGFLFTAFLTDPCEKEEVNVLETLTDAQKHELTASAQLFVRQIAFNLIHEVLGVERHVDIVTADPSPPPISQSTLKRTMELISGFHGEKLPENPAYDSFGIQSTMEDEDDEPDVKMMKMDEEAEPVAEEAESEGAEPMEAEPKIEEAEPIAMEEEAELKIEEAEPNGEEAEPIEDAV